MDFNSKDVQFNGWINGHTLDTCVAIKIFKNPNLGIFLLYHLNLKSSKIHLTSQTVFEVKKLGYDFEQILKNIEQIIGVNVVIGYITDDMENDAEYLENICPSLHFGDSQILAYSRATNTTLITCDRGLTEAAQISNVNFANPDLLHFNDFERNVKKSRLCTNIRKTFLTPYQEKCKVKPLQEIQI